MLITLKVVKQMDGSSRCSSLGLSFRMRLCFLIAFLGMLSLGLTRPLSAEPICSVVGWNPVEKRVESQTLAEPLQGLRYIGASKVIPINMTRTQVKETTGGLFYRRIQGEDGPWEYEFFNEEIGWLADYVLQQVEELKEQGRAGLEQTTQPKRTTQPRVMVYMYTNRLVEKLTESLRTKILEGRSGGIEVRGTDSSGFSRIADRVYSGFGKDYQILVTARRPSSLDRLDLVADRVIVAMQVESPLLAYWLMRSSLIQSSDNEPRAWELHHFPSRKDAYRKIFSLEFTETERMLREHGGLKSERAEQAQALELYRTQAKEKPNSNSVEQGEPYFLYPLDGEVARIATVDESVLARILAGELIFTAIGSLEPIQRETFEAFFLQQWLPLFVQWLNAKRRDRSNPWNEKKPYLWFEDQFYERIRPYYEISEIQKSNLHLMAMNMLLRRDESLFYLHVGQMFALYNLAKIVRYEDRAELMARYEQRLALLNGLYVKEGRDPVLSSLKGGGFRVEDLERIFNLSGDKQVFVDSAKLRLKEQPSGQKQLMKVEPSEEIMKKALDGLLKNDLVKDSIGAVTQSSGEFGSPASVLDQFKTMRMEAMRSPFVR